MIPRDVAHTLLNIAQAVLLNMETGKLLDAKCSLLRMTAIISVETDRSDEVEKWRVAGGFSS
jgi:hypothetical protein